MKVTFEAFKLTTLLRHVTHNFSNKIEPPQEESASEVALLNDESTFFFVYLSRKSFTVAGFSYEQSLQNVDSLTHMFEW